MDVGSIREIVTRSSGINIGEPNTISKTHIFAPHEERYTVPPHIAHSSAFQNLDICFLFRVEIENVYIKEWYHEKHNC